MASMYRRWPARAASARTELNEAGQAARLRTVLRIRLNMVSVFLPLLGRLGMRGFYGMWCGKSIG